VARHTVIHLLEHVLHNQERDQQIMATLDDLNALVAQTGADAQATADRVIAAIAAATSGAAQQIADLQAQVADLIAGNAADITPEQLQAVADGLTAVDTTIKGIAPDAPV
jgi:ABC-type transporter Mla subunit MlaD